MPEVQASPAEMRNLMAYLTRLTLDRSPDATLPGQGPIGPGTPFSEIVDPKPGEWPTYHGQLSGNRHSPLTQVNTGNVGQLALKWSFDIATTLRALETTPVVVDGLMYVSAVNQVWALDARTGRQVLVLWYYGQPRTPGQVPTGDAATGINRGIAVLGDRVFLQTDHAHVIALHRMTGSCCGTPRWRISAITTGRPAPPWS